MSDQDYVATTMALEEGARTEGSENDDGSFETYAYDGYGSEDL